MCAASYWKEVVKGQEVFFSLTIILNFVSCGYVIQFEEESGAIDERPDSVAENGGCLLLSMVASRGDYGGDHGYVQRSEQFICFS